MLPLNWLTMFSEITKPNPIPWVFIFLVFWSLPKSLNNLILSLFLIPMPESWTDITNLSSLARGCIKLLSPYILSKFWVSLFIERFSEDNEPEEKLLFCICFFFSFFSENYWYSTDLISIAFTLIFPPDLVNLSALLYKFMRTCFNLISSLSTVKLTYGSPISSLTSKPSN